MTAAAIIATAIGAMTASAHTAIARAAQVDQVHVGGYSVTVECSGTGTTTVRG